MRRSEDWRRWLMTKPYRPFDPQLYFEYRLYKNYSSGISDQWMSHGIDMVHWFMDDHFPKSVMAHGGVFAWKDGRENPDTFQAVLEYPSGFLVSYSTSLFPLDGSVGNLLITVSAERCTSMCCVSWKKAAARKSTSQLLGKTIHPVAPAIDLGTTFMAAEPVPLHGAGEAQHPLTPSSEIFQQHHVIDVHSLSVG